MSGGEGNVNVSASFNRVFGTPLSENAAAVNPQICPHGCTAKVYRDGTRLAADGALTQRYICMGCGYRFSEQSFKASNGLVVNAKYAQRTAKNLCAATENNTVAGIKEANLIEYAWRMKKRGVGDGTIHTNCSWLTQLIKHGATLNNPDSVETILATEPTYNGKNNLCRKFNTVKAYKSYCKKLAIFWEPLKITYENKDAFIAAEDELKLYVNSAGKRHGAYLQVIHDTGARRGEVAHIKRCDVNTANSTISINEPEKGSKTRTIKVPEATIARLQTIDRKYDPYIFNPNPNVHTVQFMKLRAKVCRLNPAEADRLKQIHLHTFRYGYAHKLIKQLKPQKEVQQKLGHKSSASTDRYTNTVVFNDLDWETARAVTVDEAEALAKVGYVKYDEIGGVHLYRRLKA